MQTNQVNAELPGNITDQQVTLDVRTVYKDVYGQDAMPSAQLEPFLKSKYIEYDVDKDKLKKLIIFLQQMDANAVTQEMVGTTPSTSTSTSSPSTTTITTDHIVAGEIKNSPIASQLDTASKIVSDAKGLQGSSAALLDQPVIKTVATPATTTSGTNTQNASATTAGSTATTPNKCDVKPALQTKCDAFQDILNEKYSKYPYDDEYSILYKANNGNTGLPGTCNNMYDFSNERDLYAELVAKRNKNDAQFACERSKEFNKVDDEITGVLSGGFGTPLSQAAETSVGSILPKFVYKTL